MEHLELSNWRDQPPPPLIFMFFIFLFLKRYIFLNKYIYIYNLNCTLLQVGKHIFEILDRRNEAWSRMSHLGWRPFKALGYKHTKELWAHVGAPCITKAKINRVYISGIRWRWEPCWWSDFWNFGHCKCCLWCCIHFVARPCSRNVSGSFWSGGCVKCHLMDENGHCPYLAWNQDQKRLVISKTKPLSLEETVNLLDQIKECIENQVHHTGSLVNSLLMSNFESLFQLVGGFILFLIFTLGKWCYLTSTFRVETIK